MAKRVKPKPASPRTQLEALRKDLMAATAATQAEIERVAQHQAAQDVETLRRTAEAFREIYGRLTRLDRALDELQGREARLAAAIEQAVEAAQVLKRVEFGLRPMLVKALNNDPRASWLDESYASALELYASASS